MQKPNTAVWMATFIYHCPFSPWKAVYWMREMTVSMGLFNGCVSYCPLISILFLTSVPFLDSLDQMRGIWDRNGIMPLWEGGPLELQCEFYEWMRSLQLYSHDREILRVMTGEKSLHMFSTKWFPGVCGEQLALPLRLNIYLCQ